MLNQGNALVISTNAFADQNTATHMKVSENISEKNVKWFVCNAVTAMQTLTILKAA